MAYKYTVMMTSIFKRILYLAVLVIILTSCDNRVRTSHEILFDHIFFKIKLNSIKRNVVNWTDLEKKVKDSVKVFASRKDVEKALKLTLKLLNDHHSKFIESGSNNPFLAKILPLPEVETKMVGNHIGYIKIPGFAANDSISRLYCIKIREALSGLDKQGDLSGWIIDLRGNIGGRTYIFPLGISPLLQDSGTFITKDIRGKTKIEKCADGRYFEGDKITCIIPVCNSFTNKDKPVAVLTDSITASCGEWTVLLFKNRKSTRTFGSKTRGATSSLVVWDIVNRRDSYHSQILLAVENWYDKNDKLIDGKLTPDVECLPQYSLDSAIRWIEKEAHPVISDKVAMIKPANEDNPND